MYFFLILKKTLLPRNLKKKKNTSLYLSLFRTGSHIHVRQHAVAVVVQLLSHVWRFVTPWTEAHQASLSFTISQSLLKFMSTEWWCHPTILLMPSTILVMPSNLCHPLLLLSSIFLSIRVFSNESALCIRWPKYWSFNFSISPSNEYSGLISFRMDWFDLLAVQRTLKSLLQHHSSKALFMCFKINSLTVNLLYGSNSQIHTWLPEKP